jgi:hypothetical protein
MRRRQQTNPHPGTFYTAISLRSSKASWLWKIDKRNCSLGGNQKHDNYMKYTILAWIPDL